jgi:AraC-like DNA-binding protein
MSKNLLTTPTILASSTLVLWNALEAHNHDASDIFTRAGLDPSRFKDPEARFTARSITRLHEVAIETTGDPCFMLKLGGFWHPSHLHALGYGWLASPSLQDAFRRLIRYYDVAAISAERVRMEDSDGHYLFMIDTHEDFHPLHDTEDDSIMVFIVSMCRMSIGNSFCPLRVKLRRPKPSCANEFDEYFGTSVEFSSPDLSLLLSAAEMEAELPTSNTTMARASDHIVDEYLARLAGAHIINQVRTQLIESMPAGRVHEKEIARSLNMSSRSMQRKLKQEGSAFNEILDGTRRELALSYIKDRHTSIKEITYLLGYSDPANFSRAFKRWNHMSPSTARDNL